MSEEAGHLMRTVVARRCVIRAALLPFSCCAGWGGSSRTSCSCGFGSSTEVMTLLMLSGSLSALMLNAGPSSGSPADATGRAVVSGCSRRRQAQNRPSATLHLAWFAVPQFTH